MNLPIVQWGEMITPVSKIIYIPVTFFNISRYDKLVAEGHDARLFRFSKPDDETINGGHSDPKNKEYWQVGCMGITG